MTKKASSVNSVLRTAAAPLPRTSRCGLLRFPNFWMGDGRCRIAVLVRPPPRAGTLIRAAIDGRPRSNEARPFRDGTMAVHLGARRGIQPLGERRGAAPPAGIAWGRSGHLSVPRPSLGLFARERDAGTPFFDCVSVPWGHGRSCAGHERFFGGLPPGPLASRRAG